MRILTSLVFCLFFRFMGFAQDTTQIIQAGRTNSAAQQAKPYVILISADGFRSDFSVKYDAKFLQRQEAKGVKAAPSAPVQPLCFAKFLDLAFRSQLLICSIPFDYYLKLPLQVNSSDFALRSTFQFDD